jgi:hypothetical protein
MKGNSLMIGDTIYGEFSTGSVVRIPEGHILGSRLRRSENDDPIAVEIQVRSLGNIAMVELTIPQAMFLLSVLKSVQLEIGYPFPDDPRMSTSSH